MAVLDHARNLAGDADLRDHLVQAVRESRAAASRAKQVQRRAHRRSRRLRAVVLGGAATGVATAVLIANRNSSEA